MLDKMLDAVMMTLMGIAVILSIFALIVLVSELLTSRPELSCHDEVECISFQGEVWCKKTRGLQQVGD